MTKDEADQINLQRAVYRFIADPKSVAKGAHAITNMRVNPLVTAQTLRSFSANDQKKLNAAIDAFWARGHQL